jgi:glycosyltransferase involved in cell wall biosynthesis
MIDMAEPQIARASPTEPGGSVAKTLRAWPVMVLAHNEERHIVRCLDSLFENATEESLEVFVMANGCTDRTEHVTLQYAERRAGVHLVHIDLGDKCNAWNVFIHETVPALCPARAVYFFMDGDARATPGSLAVMAQALKCNSYAHAATAPPASGRSVVGDRKAFIAEHGLVANLYALSGQFVKELQERHVQLPLKLEGDDGLLGALIKWNLDPQHQEFDHRRVVPCGEAGFTFDSVSLLDLTAWRGYWRRAVRYGRRRYEFELLGPRLKRDGIAGLPRDITTLYSESDRLSMRWGGWHTLPNWAALRQMRRIGKTYLTTP